MNLLDVRTIILSQLVTNGVCALVMALLWLQNRRRFAGTAGWALDFCFQATASLLIVLRGSIPDWASIVLSNTLVIAGALLGYRGLERFVGKKGPQAHNTFLLAAFAGAHTYFAFVQPSLAARNFNVSLGLLVVCGQCAWLLLRRVPAGLRRMTQSVGWVFAAYGLVSLARMVAILAAPQPGNDLFRSGAVDVLALLSYQSLVIMLTFSLALMVNSRLLSDVQAQEEKFTKAFRSSPYAILLTRLPDSTILEVNDSFVSIAGYSYAEAIGKTTLDLHLWVSDQDRAEVIDALSKRQPVHGAEYPFRIKSGQVMTGLFSAEIITINDQPCVLSSISDITERKQMEVALKESEQKYRLLFDEMLSGFAVHEIICDPTGVPVDYRFLSVNAAFEKMTGLNSAEILGRTVLEVLPVTEPIWIKRYGQVALTRGPAQFENYSSALGKYFEVRAFSPEPGKFATIFNDITERKQVEEALSESEKRFRTLIESAPVAITLARDGKLMYANPTYVRLHGLARADELIGRPVLERVAPQCRSESLARSRRRARGLPVEAQYELIGLRQDGTEFPMIATVARVDLADGPANIGFFQDITERKQAEEHLKETLAELERSNAELQQFAYVASHDLQEPLRMVTSYLQLLARRYQGRLDTDADEFIGFAVDGAQRMQRLIADLLAYSHVGTRGQPLRLTDGEAVLEQALLNLQVTLVENQAQVTHDPLPAVLADEGQLVQVFQNLIGNAVKFHGAEPPRIHVSARQTFEVLRSTPERSGAGETSKVWEFSVRDNGIGIEPQYHDKIFVIFQRLHGKEDYPGTGIGLALCKKIVERHGGRIRVESQPGHGSTFYFTLSAQEGTHGASPTH